jgi:hypothetical protein
MSLRQRAAADATLSSGGRELARHVGAPYFRRNLGQAH